MDKGKKIELTRDDHENKQQQSPDSGITQTKSHTVLPFIGAFLRKYKGQTNLVNNRSSAKCGQRQDGNTKKWGYANHDTNSAKTINLDNEDSKPAPRYSISSSDEGADMIKLANELERLDLQPIALERFIKYFHKFAGASGVSAENLTILIRKIVELSEGIDKDILHDHDAKISIAELHNVIQELGKKHDHLLDELEKLKIKKNHWR